MGRPLRGPSLWLTPSQTSVMMATGTMVTRRAIAVDIRDLTIPQADFTTGWKESLVN